MAFKQEQNILQATVTLVDTYSDLIYLCIWKWLQEINIHYLQAMT